jgi:hypothetical protein
VRSNASDDFRVEPQALIRALEADIQDGAGSGDGPLLGQEVDEIETIGPIAGDFQIRVKAGFEMGQRCGRVSGSG